jgi:hypothetical protein
MNKTIVTMATAAVALAVLGGAAVFAQDKDSLKVPGGLAYSEFKGYENWAVVSVHHTDELIKVVVGDPVAMDAYRAGIPQGLPRWRQDGKDRVETGEEHHGAL